MGIRETLNKNPAITTGGTIAIIVIALVVITFQLHTSRPKPYTGSKAFFTDDDGEHWFEADNTNIPPFTDKNGLTAVRCYVFKCGKNKFVGYLEKFSDEAKKQLEANNTEHTMMGPNPNMTSGGRMLKKKGETTWLAFNPTDPQSSAKYQEIIQVRCPDGSADVDPVFP